jgi:hypothetical protein
MTMQARGCRVQAVCLVALMAAACGSPDIRVRRPLIDEGKMTGITARMPAAPDGTAVTFKVTAGQECGKLSAESATTTMGEATVQFTGATGVEDCEATIEAAALTRTNRASIVVNRVPLTRARIDGISVLALFLIASFAIDRVVRAALFVLGYLPAWQRIVPEAPAAGKNQRLAYVLMAGVLAVVVLGWLGRIRIRSALGFTQTDPMLDTLFTGLLLVGGADRVQAILDRIGGGPDAGGGGRPIEITGRLVLDDSQRGQPTVISSLPGAPFNP